ncbi:MAG: glycosyltransferase [Bacteroidetes bacterium]|nr:glycosyltransferase [Bacteroidota bacterium]MBS1740767.1 glycosyltransferase [Bacteroidota bacterium]
MSVIFTAVPIYFLLGCFLFAIAVQLFFALYFSMRSLFVFYNQRHKKPDVQPVSVIICAHNEAKNLARFLPAILSQRYTNESGENCFEVIVVNDASTDESNEVLLDLEKKFQHLIHVSISQDQPRTFKGKKFALSLGVQQAQYELLLLTDADCFPTSDNWLKEMTSPLLEDKEIVAGFGDMKAQPGFLNAFIRWETLHTFVQFTGFARAGLPFMAVGRNLACKKSVFIQAQQSLLWNNIPSGDDDLLMRCCANANNTEIVATQQAITISEPKQTWAEWLHQKQRHVSTGKLYKPIVQVLLTGYAFSHAAMWTLFITLLFVAPTFYLFAGMVVRSGLYWGIWIIADKKLRAGKITPLLPFCDFGWAVYNFVLSPYIFLKNKQQWK